MPAKQYDKTSITMTDFFDIDDIHIRLISSDVGLI